MPLRRLQLPDDECQEKQCRENRWSVTSSLAFGKYFVNQRLSGFFGLLEAVPDSFTVELDSGGFIASPDGSDDLTVFL